MKLVSAAKFARANHAVLGARPYGQAFEEMAGRVVLAAGEKAATPLTTARGQHMRKLVVLVSTDRGLCGGLNNNLFKHVTKYVREAEERGEKIDVAAWVRRAISYAKKMKWTMIHEKEKATDKPRYEGAKQLAELLVTRFLEDTYDEVVVGFVEFKSAMSQIPTIRRVLPVLPKESEGAAASAAMQAILEPGPSEFLAAVIRKQVEGQVFRILLEAAASEHGARMTSMDSATKNAKEVTKKLTLQYNRGRQAAITRELIEITSGADAL